MTGIVTMQTAYYFRNFPDDKRSIKLMVSRFYLVVGSIDSPVAGRRCLVGSFMDHIRYLDLRGFRRLLDFLHTIMVFTADWFWLIEHLNNPKVTDWIPW